MFQRNARALGLALAVFGCDDASTIEPPIATDPDPEGAWQAAVETPGGDVPFSLNISSTDDGWVAKGEHLHANVNADGRTVTMEFTPYDAFIHAKLSKDGRTMKGRWYKTVSSGQSELPFRATRGRSGGFGELPGELIPDEAAQRAVSDVSGHWAVKLRTEGKGDEHPAVAMLTQDGTTVRGTFLTPSADHRYLTGHYERGVLRLSGFSGATVFLYTARAQNDGTLVGQHWSRDNYHAHWTAEPLGDRDVADVLPDPSKGVRVVNLAGTLHFLLPDLEGRTVSLQDERYKGRVVIVEVMGSWCPNCADATALLSEWYRKYREQGLEVVALAFEYVDDLERNRRVLRQFKERHGVQFPILMAGTSSGNVTASTLPDLSAITSYPTTLFVGRDGRVRLIHSGFTGPAAGPHYERMRRELESELEALLAEPEPVSGS